jgi:hypothetical protein
MRRRWCRRRHEDPAAPPSSSRPGDAPSRSGGRPRWRWRPNSLSLSSSYVWRRVAVMAAAGWWWWWGEAEAARGGEDERDGWWWGRSRDGGGCGASCDSGGGINFLMCFGISLSCVNISARQRVAVRFDKKRTKVVYHVKMCRNVRHGKIPVSRSGSTKWFGGGHARSPWALH